ncbi:MAG: flagellar basal-body MS-ring/collar protein FliF, partial [Phycisphaerae bacterium]
LLQKLAAVWKNVSIVQKALLLAIVGTMVGAAILLTQWAGRPDFRLLYDSLSPDEAGKIVDKIVAADVPYELKNGGTSIYVPKENVYQLRLNMAKEGLPEGSQKGYKIFDDAKIGVSPKVQDINLLRALQEELAKSIQMMEGVAHARIHIVSPESSLFTKGKDNTTASVALRLKPGYELSQASIAAITHLVAGAVENLKPENVTVVDSNGRLLSRPQDERFNNGATTVADYRERVEQNLSKKAEDMLTTVLGPGRATVKVSAEIDMTSLNLVTETYEPKGIPTKEEIESTTETSPSQAEAASAGKKAGETIVTEYVVGKTVEQKTIMPGEIKSLAVAAFVDLTPDTNDPNAAATAELIMPVEDVELVIKNALGLKDTDSLKVVPVKFNRPVMAEVVEEEQPGLARFMPIIQNASLGIMAICALLVFKMFAGAGKKAAAADQSQAQLPQGMEGMGLLTAAPEAAEPVVLRRQIASALQNNPEQVKKLFASWVEERE